MTYELEIAIGTILSAIASISIAIWAVISAQASKSQAETSKLQAEASKIQAELTLAQIELIQFEMNQRLRPWIGIIKFTVNDDVQIQFEYQNFGELPNSSMQGTIMTGSNPIEITELENESPSVDYIGILFPQQKRTFIVNIPKTLIEKITPNNPMFLGIKLRYHYNEVFGESLVIVKFDGRLFANQFQKAT